MAKTKKDIDAFQKAMLSNTKVIRGEDKSQKTSTNQEKKRNSAKKSTSEMISPDLLKKYEALAKELKLDPKTAIEHALKHFLELKEFWKTTE